jgi:predicted Zn-dependent protease
LALGTLDEKLGSARIYDPPLGSQDGHSDQRMELIATRTRHLDAAVRYLRVALIAEPQLLEARLRLGRVLFLRGQETSAAAELETVERTTPEPATRYLAALFQGHIHERERRLPQAAEAYGRAAGYLPGAPTADVALAHALEVGGDRARVSDLLDRALQPVDRTPAQDPWWTYLMGQSHEAQPLYGELQAEVNP